MRRFVLDASIVLAWCFPDEGAQKADKISERIALGDLPAVPAFWRYEVLKGSFAHHGAGVLPPRPASANRPYVEPGAIAAACRWYR